jgi:hypothetical protein
MGHLVMPLCRIAFIYAPVPSSCSHLKSNVGQLFTQLQYGEIFGGRIAALLHSGCGWYRNSLGLLNNAKVESYQKGRPNAGSGLVSCHCHS